MDYVDREMPCDTCGGTFIWSAGEQSFFAERDFSPPRRCSGARKARKTGGPTRYDSCPFGIGSGGGGPRPERRPSQPTRPIAEGERLQGTIVRVVADRGFGFVRDSQEQDYFFSERDMPMGSFSRVRVGDSMTFVASNSAKGLRATPVD